MKKIILYLTIILTLTSFVSAKTFTLEIDNYNIEKQDGYDILTIEGWGNNYYDEKLALPRKYIDLEFPSTQVVEDLYLVEFRDPIELELNIPSVEDISEDWEDEFNFYERKCYISYTEPSFAVYDPYYEEDMTSYRIIVDPVEVVDCEKGLFKLYREVEYEAKIIQSLSRIEKTEMHGYPIKGNTIYFTILMNREVDGKLIVSDYTEEEYSVARIQGKKGVISLTLPETFSRNEFVIKYIEDEKLVDFENYFLESSWGEFDFLVYESEDESTIPIKINITNYYEKDIVLDGEIQLISWDGEVTSEYSLNKKISSGNNVIDYGVSVSESEKQNDIKIILSYDGEDKEVIHNTLMRIDPERAKEAQREYKELMEERKNDSKDSNSIWVAVIVGFMLFSIAGYALWFCFKRD